MSAPSSVNVIAPQPPLMLARGSAPPPRAALIVVAVTSWDEHLRVA